MRSCISKTPFLVVSRINRAGSKKHMFVGRETLYPKGVKSITYRPDQTRVIGQPACALLWNRSLEICCPFARSSGWRFAREGLPVGLR